MEIGRAKLPVPGGGQAPTTPGDLANFATRVDKFLAHQVTDAADRDNRFGDADPGTVTVSTNGTMWARTTGGVWVVIHEEPEPWRPLSLATGFVAGEEAPKIRRIGKQVWIRGRAQKADGSLIRSDGATKLATVPDDCIPTALASGAAGQTLTGDPFTGVGRVEVLPYNWERPEGGQGSVMWYSQDGSGTTWAGVDLSYWID